MKKKFNLLTAIMTCLVIYVVLSWIIPTGMASSGEFVKGGVKPIGLFGLIYYPGVVIETFIQFGVMLLATGGLYGVMNKTGVYSNLVDEFVRKYKGRERTFLIIVISILVIASSVLGLPIQLLILVPFLMGVLLRLGYNKITTVAATVGSILLGSVAATFGYSNAAYIAKVYGFEITTGIISKGILLAIILLLFSMFVSGNSESTISKEKKSSKKDDKNAKGKEEVAKENAILIPFAEESISSTRDTKSLKAVFFLIIGLVFVTMFNWNYVFGITLFDEIHDKILAFTVKDFPLISNFFGFLNAIGRWELYDLTGLLLLGSIIIGWVYSLKFEEIIEGFLEGAKRIAKTAILITLANIVFILVLDAGDSNIAMFISDKIIGISDKFNIVLVSISTIFTSLFVNNFSYAFSFINDIIGVHYNVAGNASIIGFVIQGIHSLMMLILPTSIVLIAGLSLLDVSFKDWIKYIWKFMLQILVIILIIGLILTII